MHIAKKQLWICVEWPQEAPIDELAWLVVSTEEASGIILILLPGAASYLYSVLDPYLNSLYSTPYLLCSPTYQGD